MGDKKVKGTILVDQVRMIRSNKDRNWDKYLTPQDWEVVNGRILPSMWYPLEIFQRCGLATFHEIAGGRLDLVRAWGRMRMDELSKDVYKILVRDPDPVKALDRFVMMRGQLFNFSDFTCEKVGEKHIKITQNHDPNDEGAEVYAHQLMGMMDRLTELTGGKNVSVSLASSEWKGDKATVFDIRWD